MVCGERPEAAVVPRTCRFINSPLKIIDSQMCLSQELCINQINKIRVIIK